MTTQQKLQIKGLGSLGDMRQTQIKVSLEITMRTEFPLLPICFHQRPGPILTQKNGPDAPTLAFMMVMEAVSALTFSEIRCIYMLFKNFASLKIQNKQSLMDLKKQKKLLWIKFITQLQVNSKIKVDLVP